MNVKSVLARAVIIFSIFTVLCGGIYTLAVTGISQALFNNKANGSMIQGKDGQQYCILMGQKFTDEKHMWGREMSLSTVSFEKQGGELLMYAGPSNISPASDDFSDMVEERVKKIRVANPEMGDIPVPVDLVTNSGSGLDPEISVAAAQYQVQRLSRSNGISEDEVQAIIDKCTKESFLGIFGEKRVNVVEVNLMLDGIIEK